MLRFGGVISVFGVAICALLSSARGETDDDLLRQFAVTITRPQQTWTGQGVYLGLGLVLTAGHVANLFLPTKPDVGIAGLKFSGSPIKNSPFDEDDLAFFLSMRVTFLLIYRRGASRFAKNLQASTPL